MKDKSNKLIRSFGRRIAKPLSLAKKDKLENILPRILISKNPTKQLLDLFPQDIEKICLDIGFGSGENLIQKVIDNPTVGFIGSEVFQNGIVAFLAHWENANCPQNILVYNDDVRELIENFSNNSIDVIDLFYPDPWHKKRHHKRRMVADSTIDLFSKKLKKNGKIRLVSDIENYIENAQGNFKKHPRFEIFSLSKTPFKNWITTRYEQKAIRENRFSQYMEVIRK